MSLKTPEIKAYIYAFYGGIIPNSQLEAAEDGIQELANKIFDDLLGAVPGADSDMFAEGIHATLSALHEFGAHSPGIYQENPNQIATQAFRLGVAKVKERLELKTMKVEEEEAAANKARRNLIAEEIEEAYLKFKQWAVKEGYECPELEAWKCLLDKNNGLNINWKGYAYYLIAYKIPTRTVIQYVGNDGTIRSIMLFDHPEVIRVMKTDKRFFDYNGEPWRTGPSRMDMSREPRLSRGKGYNDPQKIRSNKVF